MEIRTLNQLTEDDIGMDIRILYTNVSGVLEYVNTEYEDDVKVIVSGEIYYLPGDYPIAESVDFDDYDPSVLLGVVDPWSPL